MNTLKCWITVFLNIILIKFSVAVSDNNDISVSHDQELEFNEIDTVSKIKDIFRGVSGEAGSADINALLTANIEDPVPLEPFNVSSNGFISNIHGRFSELQLYGLRGFQLDSLAINLSKMNLSAEMSVPILSIVGEYFLQGSLTFLQVSGEGPFYMNMSNIILRGHSILQATPEGKLSMGNVALDSHVGDISLQFENLMGGGAWGSISNSLLNQLSELILGELKPTLLRELSSFLKYQFDEVLFDNVPSGFMDPGSTSLVDSVLKRTSRYMVSQGMEPLPLPNYREAFERQLFFVTTRGELEFFNGTLYGLSTLRRKGDVITVFANDSLQFEADFEFENLTATYQWLAEAFNAGTRGRVNVQVRSVEGYIKIKRQLKAGSSLEIDKFHIKGIRQIWLDLQGVGSWNYIMESIINLITNGMKLQLADAIAEPLRKSIQEQLDQLNSNLLS